MEETQKQPGNMKSIGIIVAFVIILVIIGAVLIARISHNAGQNSTYSANNNPTPIATATPAYTPTPTPNMDTSNTQLDQDLQTSQGNLNKLDTELNTTDQSLTNQSADTPTQ